MPVLADTGTAGTSPPYSSTTISCSVSWPLTLSGLTSSRSILLMATMTGHVGRLGVLDGLDRLRHHAVVGRDHEDHDVGHVRPAGTHGREGGVAGGVDEGDEPVVLGDLVGTDVLGDAARLAGDDVGVADRVEQQRLAVVDVAHDRDDGGSAREVLRVLRVLDAELELLVGHEVDLEAELGREDLDGVLGQRLLHRHHLAHLEQLLDDRCTGDVELLRDLVDRRAAQDVDAVDLDLLLERQVAPLRGEVHGLLGRLGPVLAALALAAPTSGRAARATRATGTATATGTTGAAAARTTGAAAVRRAARSTGATRRATATGRRTVSRGTASRRTAGTATRATATRVRGGGPGGCLAQRRGDRTTTGALLWEVGLHAAARRRRGARDGRRRHDGRAGVGTTRDRGGVDLGRRGAGHAPDRRRAGGATGGLGGAGTAAAGPVSPAVSRRARPWSRRPVSPWEPSRRPRPTWSAGRGGTALRRAGPCAPSSAPRGRQRPAARPRRPCARARPPRPACAGAAGGPWRPSCPPRAP